MSYAILFSLIGTHCFIVSYAGVRASVASCTPRRCVCVWISRIFQFFPHRSLVFSLLSYDVCFVLWTVEKVYALAEQLPQRPLSLVAFALTPSRTCGSTKDAVRGDTEERSRHTCIRAT